VHIDQLFGRQTHGKELSEKLAASLGYQCISREEITNQATEYGIPVGKLETAILKRQLISEELAIETERFKAFITAAICERARSGGVVYHGRIGHMVLQGINHVLKVRVCANENDRIQMVMQRMNLTQKLAKDYIQQVDEDRCRYAHFFYNVNCNDPSIFDVVVNLSHLPVDASITSLAALAQLPEFQPTPDSILKADDLLLQARCRIVLGEDDRTKDIKVKINSANGNVSITYLPAYENQARAIPVVLEKIEGLKSVICTMATTNILYVQEKFSAADESFKHLIEIAGKWNASVEPIRLEHKLKEETGIKENRSFDKISGNRKEDGGILDDTAEEEIEDNKDFGILEIMNRLIQVGRAGTAHTVYGGTDELIKEISRSSGHCLVVVGAVYLSAASASRKRFKRELINLLSDHSRVPVISSEDLQEQYLFGSKQKIKLLIYAVLTALIYLLVFNNQDFIFNFLSASGTTNKILAVVLICILTPATAYVISGFFRNILKMLKLE